MFRLSLAKIKQSPYAYRVPTLIAFGTILNLTLALISFNAKSVLFLDMVGTAYVAILGGMLPGISVALLTNLLGQLVLGFQDYASFAIVNVVGAIIWAAGPRSGYAWLGYGLFNQDATYWQLLYPVIMLGLIVGGVCGLVSAFVVSGYVIPFFIDSTLTPPIVGSHTASGISGQLGMALKEVANASGWPAGPFFPMALLQILANVLDKTIATGAVLILAPAIGTLPNFRIQRRNRLMPTGRAPKILTVIAVLLFATYYLFAEFAVAFADAWANLNGITKGDVVGYIFGMTALCWFIVISALILLRVYFFRALDRDEAVANSAECFQVASNPNTREVFEDILKLIWIFLLLLYAISFPLVNHLDDPDRISRAFEGALGVTVVLTGIRYLLVTFYRIRLR